jgi:putative transposase
LAAAGVQISMDGKGRALDNVIIERFWRNLKYDDVYLKGYTTPREARHGIAAYMHRYNEIRLHEALGYHTPGSVYRGDMPRADGKNGAWG